MRVFLTGGTGFIGLALADRLVREGIEVVATSDAPPPDWARKALPDVRFDTVDVRDKQALIAAMAGVRPNILIHGAALTPDAARERAGGTAAIFEINVGGTANALEAAAQTGVGRVMAFSSGAAYGRTIEEVPVLQEEIECRPTALYAISKLAAERVALRLGALHGLSVVTPRLSAAWGPWEYRTSVRQTLSPGYQIVEAVVRGARPILPQGAELPLVFSEDAADMLVRLATTRQAEGVFNIGSDHVADLGPLAEQAVLEAGRRGFEMSGAEQEVALFVAGRPPMDMSRLAQAIGDWPRTDPAEAIGKTLDWYAALPEPRPF